MAIYKTKRFITLWWSRTSYVPPKNQTAVLTLDGTTRLISTFQVLFILCEIKQDEVSWNTLTSQRPNFTEVRENVMYWVFIPSIRLTPCIWTVYCPWTHIHYNIHYFNHITKTILVKISNTQLKEPTLQTRGFSFYDQEAPFSHYNVLSNISHYVLSRTTHWHLQHDIQL